MTRTTDQSANRAVTPDRAVVVQLTGGGATRFIAPGTQPAGAEHDNGLPRRGVSTCALFAPGHHVHAIQARLGLRSPSRPFDLVDVTGHDVTVRDQDGVEAHWWLHDTDVVVAALLLDAAPMIRLHSHGLARIDTALLYPALDGPTVACSGQ